MRLQFRLLFGAALFAALASGAADQCQFAPSQPFTSPSLPRRMICPIGKDNREALVYAPSITTKDTKLPVVFCFHGHGGNMMGAAQEMHIQTVWTEAIVVYPQGLPTKTPVDPGGDHPGWQVEAGTYGDRDLKFFDAMLAMLRQKFSVDDKRIYTTGFSNGGTFSYLLWAERGQTLAAIGEVAGRYMGTQQLGPPRPLLAIAGHQDTTDPFPLQVQTIEKARQADNATGPGQQCPIPSGAPPGTKCALYPSTSQTAVNTLIHPEAHVYRPWMPAPIVEFFKNHQQP